VCFIVYVFLHSIFAFPTCCNKKAKYHSPEESKESLASSSMGGQDSSNRSEKPVRCVLAGLRYACRLSACPRRGDVLASCAVHRRDVCLSSLPPWNSFGSSATEN
jgi:hypothetical protein